MPTILRVHGMRFVIYVEDHRPAHVHVIGNGTAKIAFEKATASLEYNRGMSKRDINRALDVVERNRALFTTAWNDIHG